MNNPNFKVGDKVLVSTDNWFMAPDGDQYRAAYGTVKGIRGDQETLGIRTNARSTNWYAEVGCLLIAGCQIHYAAKTDNCHLGDVKSWEDGKDGAPGAFVTRPSRIYDADKVQQWSPT